LMWTMVFFIDEALSAKSVLQILAGSCCIAWHIVPVFFVEPRRVSLPRLRLVYLA
jgi:hypothetical protein